MATQVAVNGNLDGALKRFKTKCARDGVLSEVKKRKFYKKPGVVRKEKEEINRRNSMKKNKNRY